MTIKKSIIAAILILNNFKIVAQQEQSLHFLQNVWQSNLTNPALVSDKKLTIMLPSLYFNVHSEDFTINDLFKKDGEGKLNLNDVANRVQPQNRMDANVSVQSLGISYKLQDKLTVSLYHAVNSNPSVNVNGDLVRLVANGNVPFLGKTVSFNSSGNGSVYSEIGLGAAYQIQSHFNIGARVKFLNGIAGVFTPKGINEGDKLNVSFDKNDYSLGFDNDFKVLAYSFSKFKKINTASDLVSQGFSGSNKGMAFDLGASLKVGKISLAASVIDLAGSIKWQNDGKSYASKGKYTYSGANSNDFFNIDSLSSNSFKDTLKSIIGFTETDNPSFAQKLPTKIYLSATYALTEKLRLGALLYNETGGLNASHTGFALNATYRIIKALELGGTVGLRNGSFNNLGMHFVAQLGPVQLFGVTDNIISAFRPYDSKNANGRLGLNITL